MTDKQDLPVGWVETTVGDLYDMIGGGTPSTKVPEYWQGNIPWITSADIHGIKDIKPERYISESAIKHSATNLVPKGSIIVVTRVGLGKVALATHDICFSQDSQALVSQGEYLDSTYILYYLSQVVQIFKYQNRGTTIAGVTKKQLASLPVPLAPLAEQRRIVSKIEELFSDLDQGEAALRKVQTLLTRYRQAVLKAAVTGELTRDWRAANRHRLESGEDLLQRILQARREQWQGRGKYKEPQPPDTSNLPELPEGWVWASVEQLFSVFIGSTPSRRESGYWGGDIPWVSSGEIAFCRIKSTRETITKEGYDNSSVRLHPKGTVLLAMIGEGKTRGQAAILDIEACHNQIGLTQLVSPVVRYAYERTKSD
jgi:type I restriction enzyme S subunit